MSQINDPIADLLTRLRNSVCADHERVSAAYSKTKADIARILKSEGYIADYTVDTTTKFPTLQITNRYVNRVPAITGLRRVSKPGLRKYVRVADIPRVLGGMGIAIVSTSQGIMSGNEAKKANAGGELLAFVW